MATRRELEQLLAVAIGLVYGAASRDAESIRIGDAQFRLITKQHERHGWILLLVEEREHEDFREHMLMSRYGLTARQVEVARLLSERLSNREVAERLGVSPSTAERHTERVMQKLGVTSRREVREKLQDSMAAD